MTDWPSGVKGPDGGLHSRGRGQRVEEPQGSQSELAAPAQGSGRHGPPICLEVAGPFPPGPGFQPCPAEKAWDSGRTPAPQASAH